jgi:hypothetical protein
MASTNYDYEDQSLGYARLVGRAWADPDFAAQLKANPRAVLAGMGIEIAGTQKIVVKQNDKNNVYFALDAQPANQLAQIEIQKAAAFACFGTVGTLGTAGSACGCVGTAASFGTAGSWQL